MSFEALANLIAQKKAADAQKKALKEQQEFFMNYLNNVLWPKYEAFDWGFSMVDPLASEQFGGISTDVALMLGQPAGYAWQRGGPASQASALAGAMSPDQDNNMARAAQMLGFDNVGELQQAQHQWEQDYQTWIADTEDLRQAIRENRYQGYEDLSRMAADFPTTSQADFDTERAVQFDALLAEIQQAREREQAQILQSAQAGGYNPAGALGRLAETTSLQEQQAQSEAIARALAVQSGRVNTASQAIQGLGGALYPGLQMQEQLGGLATQGLVSLGNQAASQMNAYNQGFMSMLGADYSINTIPFAAMQGNIDAALWQAIGQTAYNVGSQYNPSAGANSYLGNSTGASSIGNAGGYGGGPATGRTAGGTDTWVGDWGNQNPNLARGIA